jgi:hypothetical protein
MKLPTKNAKKALSKPTIDPRSTETGLISAPDLYQRRTLVRIRMRE